MKSIETLGIFAAVCVSIAGCSTPTSEPTKDTVASATATHAATDAPKRAGATLSAAASRSSATSPAATDAATGAATDVATGAATDAASASAQAGAIPAPGDVAQAPADAKKEASGLITKVLTVGKGKDKPRPHDTVKVHYSGWTTDGKMFDSSVPRNAPAEFPVDGVIKGWTEGLQLMVAGEKRRFWIPGELAYGKTPRMGAPAGDLTFDVELLEIQKAPEPPPVPADLAKPPKTAKKTKSGLVYRVLAKGKGKAHPSGTDTVKVHYSGWSKDGKLFDSSVMRNKPATFALDGVIKGWTEGVQLMTEGERVRFWIPADLAYGAVPKRPGAPSGDLVFDVELLEIMKRAERR